MAEKKYKVADNSSVVVKGVMLKPGEAIPDGAVAEAALKQLVAAKLIVEDKSAETKPTKESGKESGGKSGGKSGAGKDGGKDAGDKDASGEHGADSGAGENADANGGQA